MEDENEITENESAIVYESSIGKNEAIDAVSHEDKDASMEADIQNTRFIQMVSYFIEWAKHIITISSGVMVLSVAFLKDVVRGVEPSMRVLLVLLLAAAFFCLVGAIATTLRFISSAAASILTPDRFITSPAQLEDFRKLLAWVQRLFLLGMATFTAFAIVSLLSWIITPI